MLPWPPRQPGVHWASLTTRKGGRADGPNGSIVGIVRRRRHLRRDEAARDRPNLGTAQGEFKKGLKEGARRATSRPPPHRRRAAPPRAADAPPSSRPTAPSDPGPMPRPRAPSLDRARRAIRPRTPFTNAFRLVRRQLRRRLDRLADRDRRRDVAPVHAARRPRPAGSCGPAAAIRATVHPSACASSSRSISGSRARPRPRPAPRRTAGTSRPASRHAARTVRRRRARDVGLVQDVDREASCLAAASLTATSRARCTRPTACRP